MGNQSRVSSCGVSVAGASNIDMRLLGIFSSLYSTRYIESFMVASRYLVEWTRRSIVVMHEETMHYRKHLYQTCRINAGENSCDPERCCCRVEHGPSTVDTMKLPFPSEQNIYGDSIIKILLLLPLLYSTWSISKDGELFSC